MSTAATITIPPTSASIKHERAIRLIATAACILVALSSGALSWASLTSLALASGFPHALAWALPVSIDGMMIAGSLGVLHATLRGSSTRFPWFVVTLGAAVSVWGNVLASQEHGVTASILHGFIPLALLLSMESVLRLVRERISTDLDAAREAAERARREAEREARRVAREQAASSASSKPRERAVKGGGARTRRAVSQDRQAVREALREAYNRLATEGMTASAVVRALIRQVPEAACSDLVAAGVLAQEGDTPQQHSKRVENALTRARRMAAA